MSGQFDAAKDRVLHAAAGEWGEERSSEEVGRLYRFLRLYYRHVAAEELRQRSAAEIHGPALSHERLAKQRPQGRARVRAYTPDSETGWDTGHSVVEIVTDDAPFLVSSATNELNGQGVGVHLVVHPQLRVERDLHGALVEIEPAEPTLPLVAESWIHIEIDRQTDPAKLRHLETRLEHVLADVRHVNEDAEKMVGRALALADELAAHATEITAGGVKDHEVRESADFLRWAADRHFTFMGYREYDLVTASSDGEDGERLALRQVAGTGLGVLRADAAVSDALTPLPPESQAKAREPNVLVLTKANSRATVHQARYLDYIGVKRFDADGNVVGERRFLGLYTHEAATMSIAHIPILRRKLSEVLELAGLSADSYDGKELIEILDGFPREELFQASTEELYGVVRGVLRLRERRGTKLFLRRDPYGRFVSCLVYMPRDRFNTRVRLDIQDILLRAFQGATMEHSVMVTAAPLARLYILIRAQRGQKLPDVDHAALEAEVIKAARSWDDDLVAELNARFGADRATELLHAYGDALPEGYKVDVPPDVAVDDLVRIDRLGPDALSVNLYQPAGGTDDEWRCKIYRTSDPVSLSRVLPLLEHMGLEVVDERPYGITPPRDRAATRTAERAWIYDFGLGEIPSVELSHNRLKFLFEDAFTALWHGYGESDGFNALVVRAGLTWRQLTILRAYAKYLRQTGSTFSPAYIADVLVANVHIANLLVRLFESRFEPRHTTGREERSQAIAEEIRGELDAVASLDHDRILRYFLAAVEATVRTNHFQRDPHAGEDAVDAGKPYLVLKLDPHGIPDLPAPRPRSEIYVYSPRVEGTHLRFGAVSRGGLRWSDRPEDFRTEVLGLAKAQTVKNAVIVPSGAKGGFVCKRLPSGDDRAAVQREVVSCYEQFVSGLLDVIDNRVNGEVVHPEDVVRHDSDDSYLVVAADKGTATFSDIANRIAAERGFWLGDAFASGGSVGYDHKEMGITARGAWESVKYHFREMGTDVQREDVTVVGIGDMSGDVFGNGMLLSRHIRLVAAFDHRHVFLDPHPDAERGFQERLRLFRMRRSTWEDYDPELISEGGGVYSRSVKSVPVTPQVRDALGIDHTVTSLTPAELIHHILCAPVDLLWNGGIGTYVKATGETNADVGDKANDAVRVDAGRLRCSVIGEGGNLGLTQLARIEFALSGGRVNSDFIDNSAGVDTSDHEVNIKILLDREVRAGRLSKEERDELFMGMTEEVAQLVLRNNYNQNVVLAAARKQAAGMLHVHRRYLRSLERAGHLKRDLEFLPDDKTIAARRSNGQGLTGPEFATLVAYTKITLSEEVSGSELANDPYLNDTLVAYFPSPLRERFADAMPHHPLAREIVTNSVVNDMVNQAGSTFAFRIIEETGADAAEVTRAYLVVREVYGLGGFWEAVEELGDPVDIDTRLAMLLEARKLAERASRWLLRNRTSPYSLSEQITFFGAGVGELVPQLPELLQGRDLRAFRERRDWFTARGAPEGIAERVAGMVPAYSTFDLVEIAERTGRPLRAVAEVYFDLAEQLGISRLRERIIALPRDDRWNTMARSAMRDDLYSAHAELARDVLRCGDAGQGAEELRKRWLERNEAAVDRVHQTLSEIWETERFDLATLSVALRSVRSLVAGDG